MRGLDQPSRLLAGGGGGDSDRRRIDANIFHCPPPLVGDEIEAKHAFVRTDRKSVGPRHRAQRRERAPFASCRTRRPCPWPSGVLEAGCVLWPIWRELRQCSFVSTSSSCHFGPGNLQMLPERGAACCRAAANSIGRSGKLPGREGEPKRRLAPATTNTETRFARETNAPLDQWDAPALEFASSLSALRWAARQSVAVKGRPQQSGHSRPRGATRNTPKWSDEARAHATSGYCQGDAPYWRLCADMITRIDAVRRSSSPVRNRLHLNATENVAA